MLTREYIAYQLQKYKEAHKIFIEDMARMLGISQTSLVDYIKGRGNLRSDTIDLIVSKLGITLPEVFSDPVPGAGQALVIAQAAALLGDILCPAFYALEWGDCFKRTMPTKDSAVMK